LKHVTVVPSIIIDQVETLRKPSTGLKLNFANELFNFGGVETLRKPSTGLKLFYSLIEPSRHESRHSENPARD